MFFDNFSYHLSLSLTHDKDLNVGPSKKYMAKFFFRLRFCNNILVNLSYCDSRLEPRVSFYMRCIHAGCSWKHATFSAQIMYWASRQASSRPWSMKSSHPKVGNKLNSSWGWIVTGTQFSVYQEWSRRLVVDFKRVHTGIFRKRGVNQSKAVFVD